MHNYSNMQSKKMAMNTCQIFKYFVDSCLQNDPFSLISRIRALHWKNTPFFREDGYERGIRFGRECVCAGVVVVYCLVLIVFGTPACILHNK